MKLSLHGATVLTWVSMMAPMPIISSSFVMPSVLKARPISISTMKKSTLHMASESKSSSVVIISPPGGIGEVTAVESAKLGASVRWFVISSSSSSNKVSFSEDSLSAITSAGGKVDLAGSGAEDYITCQLKH